MKNSKIKFFLGKIFLIETKNSKVIYEIKLVKLFIEKKIQLMNH